MIISLRSLTFVCVLKFCCFDFDVDMTSIYTLYRMRSVTRRVLLRDTAVYVSK